MIIQIVHLLVACGSPPAPEVAAPPPPVEVPVPAPAPTPAADPFDVFAGFSADGRSFAWVAASPSLPDLLKLQTISVGEVDPSMMFVDSDEARTEAKAKLATGGYTATRTPGTDLQIEGDITATPPTLTLVREGKRSVVPIGSDPYPPTDVAEVWGLSPDGRHVAVWIHGRDVPGLLSKGGGGTFHFYFVAPAP